jgi:hypothetical protein
MYIYILIQPVTYRITFLTHCTIIELYYLCILSFYLVEHESGWYFSIFLLAVGLSNTIFGRDEKIGSSKDDIREKKIDEILK